MYPGLLLQFIWSRPICGTYLVEEPHAYLGITALALVVFTPIMGFMQFRIKDKRMRIIHRWSGRLAITMVLINVARMDDDPGVEGR